jgi:hypothetical protein
MNRWPNSSVTPPELRSTAGDLHEVSSRMQGVMSSLRAQIGGEGGDVVVAGDAKSFWSQLGWAGVGGGQDPLAGLLRGLPEGAADIFEHSDEASARHLTIVWHLSAGNLDGY